MLRALAWTLAGLALALSALDLWILAVKARAGGWEAMTSEPVLLWVLALVPGPFLALAALRADRSGALAVAGMVHAAMAAIFAGVAAGIWVMESEEGTLRTQMIGAGVVGLSGVLCGALAAGLLGRARAARRVE